MKWQTRYAAETMVYVLVVVFIAGYIVIIE